MMNGKKGMWMVKINMNRWPSKTRLNNAIHCLSFPIDSNKRSPQTMRERGIQRVEKASQAKPCHAQLPGSAGNEAILRHDLLSATSWRCKFPRNSVAVVCPIFLDFWTFGDEGVSCLLCWAATRCL